MALPPEIIRLISSFLVKDASSGDRTLQLVALCGTCRSFRQHGHEVAEPVAFDGSNDGRGALDDASSRKGTVQRFRRAKVAHKRNVFLGASRLLTGYSDLTLSGEAIDDQVLLNVAAANGPTLTSLRVLGAPNVTDAGLCTLISAAPNLKSFTIEDAGPGVVGHFMPTLLQHCKQLESLVVDGGEAMSWAALRASGAWAAAMAAAAQAAANAAAGDSSNEDSSSGGGGGGSAHARRGYAAAAAAVAASSGTSSASHQQPYSQQHPQQQMQPSLSAHDNGHGVFEAHASSSHRHQLARHTGSITSGSRVLAAAAAAGGGSGSNSAFAAAAVAAAAGPSQQHFAQQQQQGPHAHRLSSSSSYGGHSTDYSSCPEDDAVDVDSEDVDGGDRADAGNARGGASSTSSSISSGSSSRSLDAVSDSTSISMPSQAVEALTQQLQHILSGGGAGGQHQQHQQHQHYLGGQHPPPAAAAAAGGGGAGANNSSNRSQQQAAGSAPAHAGQQQQQEQQQQSSSLSSRRSNSSSAGAAAAAAKFSHTVLRRLRVRLANTDTLQQLLECVPSLTELSLDGPALSVQAAAVLCPGLRRLSYLVCSPSELDAALVCLGNMRNLRSLELEVKGMVLSTEQLRVIGLLPLRELSLDSHAYRQHPSMPRPQYSHLDNDGVKGLVDSICSRMRTELMPLKLSLCGATALKQEAVSALLRLPILASIDTGGCVKLTPMDRMRLVAKVKAGQGLLDRNGGASGAQRDLQLRLPHHML